MRQHNDRAWLAWHTAILPLQKRFPKLSSLQVKQNAKPVQSWQEQLAIAHMWAMHGHGMIGRKQ